jgi:hypothetical protein
VRIAVIAVIADIGKNKKISPLMNADDADQKKPRDQRDRKT